MRQSLITGGSLLVGALLLAGCAGTSTSPGGVSAAGGGVSASAGASGSLTGECRAVQQTLQDLPSRLEQAATSDDPADDVPAEIQQIRDELTSEVGDADSDLRDAVESYIDKLQDVAGSIRNGERPDLSGLDNSAIDDVCASVSGSVTVSPSPTS